MINLPSGGAWKVSQESDMSGTVIGTKNMDFNAEGYATLARKSAAITSSSSYAFFGNPLVFLNDGTYYYLIQDQGMTVYNFANGLFPAVEFQSGGSVPTYSTYSDAVFFNGLLTSSTSTNIYTYTGGTAGTFASVISGLSASFPHPLCVMENNATLLVGNGNVVNQYDTTYTIASVNNLTLPKEYVVTWIRYRQSTAIIGTRNIAGGVAKVFLWNANSLSFQSGYGVGADWVYSGIEYSSSMAVITSAGRLLRFNGSGFDELAHLPVDNTSFPWTSRAPVTSLVGRVANRGMAVQGDNIYINLDGALDLNSGEYPGNYLDLQPGGLWVYDPSVGFYHKAGYASDAMLQLIPTTVASGNLVFAVPHQAVTGDAIYYQTGTGLTGINVGQTYFAIVAGTNAVGLALTPQNALNGTQIVLGGSVSGDTFVFTTHTQEGASQIVSPGFTFSLQRPHINTFAATEVMYGGQVLDATGTSRNVIMSLANSRTRGYWISPKLQSSQITDSIQNIYTKFDPLMFAGDAIILKYRGSRRDSTSTLPANITWTSTTTFTCDATQYDVRNIQIGDEIEVLSGAGAGYTAHVTIINTGSSLYVFTIDEVLPVASTQVSTMVSANWKKYGTINTATKITPQSFGGIGVESNSTWYQFKVELRGETPQMNGLKIVTSVSRAAN